MKTVEMRLANESISYGDALYDDKALFVKNLGTLLSQTREQVIGCDYMKQGEKEYVTVHYKGGHKQVINVSMNSYMAIVRDVTKNL